MNKKNNFSEISEEDKKIISEIKNDLVPDVSQKEITDVCKTAYSYYTKNQGLFDKEFWKAVLSCLSVKSLFFWILGAFFLGSCVLVSMTSAEPIAIMTALAPVPVITFAIRELQYRDDNLAQIEMTCKYSPKKIYFARLWLGMLFNAIWVSLAGTVAFSGYENLVQLYLCSFIALFFIGAAALFLMSLSDNTLPLSLTMIAWVLGAAFLLSGEEFIYIITTMSIWILAGITIFSAVLFAVAALKTTAKLYA